MSEAKLRRVGIYKIDTNTGRLICVSMCTSYGTEYFSFREDVFIRGWFQLDPNGKPIGRDSALQAVWEDSNHSIPESFEEVMLRWNLTPTQLRYLQRTNQRRLRHLRPLKGNHGGRRLGSGRKRKENDLWEVDYRTKPW